MNNTQQYDNANNCFDSVVVKEILIQETTDVWIKQFLFPNHNSKLNDHLTESYIEHGIDTLPKDVHIDIFLESTERFYNTLSHHIRMDGYALENEIQNQQQNEQQNQGENENHDNPGSGGNENPQQSNNGGGNLVEKVKTLFSNIIRLVESTFNKIFQVKTDDEAINEVMEEFHHKTGGLSEQIKIIMEEATKAQVTDSAEMAAVIRECVQDMSDNGMDVTMNFSRVADNVAKVRAAIERGEKEPMPKAQADNIFAMLKKNAKSGAVAEMEADELLKQIDGVSKYTKTVRALMVIGTIGVAWCTSTMLLMPLLFKFGLAAKVYAVTPTATAASFHYTAAFFSVATVLKIGAMHYIRKWFIKPMVEIGGKGVQFLSDMIDNGVERVRNLFRKAKEAFMRWIGRPIQETQTVAKEKLQKHQNDLKSQLDKLVSDVGALSSQQPQN